MPTFGKCQGGGRRVAARAEAALPAMVTTVGDTHAVALVDISCTGAQLRGADLPEKGHELVIKVGTLQVFATVVWTRSDQCGVTFESPVANWQVEHLRREAGSARLMRLSPEQKLALDDWTIGLAR